MSAQAVVPRETRPLAWQDQAACRDADPELFFPGKGESARPAKKVCRACRVRRDCLGYALERDERHGVWGGLTEAERSGQHP